MSPEPAHYTAFEMTTTQESSKSSKDSSVYNSKYRTITILNLENYPQFEKSCKTTLMSARLWSLVTRATPRPGENSSANAKEKWDEKAGKAIGILNSFVINLIRDTFKAFITLEIDLPRL